MIINMKNFLLPLEEISNKMMNFQIQEQPDNKIYYMYLSITPNLQVNYLYITFLLFGINGLN